MFPWEQYKNNRSQHTHEANHEPYDVLYIYCKIFDQDIARQRFSKYFPTYNNIAETVFYVVGANQQ